MTKISTEQIEQTVQMVSSKVTPVSALTVKCFDAVIDVLDKEQELAGDEVDAFKAVMHIYKGAAVFINKVATNPIVIEAVLQSLQDPVIANAIEICTEDFNDFKKEIEVVIK